MKAVHGGTVKSVPSYLSILDFCGGFCSSIKLCRFHHFLKDVSIKPQAFRSIMLGFPAFPTSHPLTRAVPRSVHGQWWFISPLKHSPLAAWDRAFNCPKTLPSKLKWLSRELQESVCVGPLAISGMTRVCYRAKFLSRILGTNRKPSCTWGKRFTS